MDRNRFFAFGCSFTRYIWPTWADIIGKQFNYYENWGMSGGGNLYINNSVIECHIVNKIDKDDTVGIMWTNPTRYDMYHDRHWDTGGNIGSQTRFKELGFDIRGFYIRDLALMYNTKLILDSIGCKYFFTSMVDINNADQYTIHDIRSELNDLIDNYKPLLDQFLPSVHKIIFNYDWASRPYGTKGHPWHPLFKNKKRQDLHPLPLEHLEYIERVLPEYYRSVDVDTKEWCHKVNNEIINGPALDLYHDGDGVVSRW